MGQSHDRSSEQQGIYHHPRGLAQETWCQTGDEVRRHRRWDVDFPDADERCKAALIAGFVEGQGRDEGVFGGEEAGEGIVESK